ncbi:hypothetical protein VKS41_007016 [Umbelopsis sp. WA50703]
MADPANQESSQRNLSSRRPSNQQRATSTSVHHASKKSSTRYRGSTSRQNSSSNLMPSRRKLKRSPSSKHHIARQRGSEASSIRSSRSGESSSDNSRNYRLSGSRRHSRDDNDSNNEDDDGEDVNEGEDEEEEEEGSDREMTLKDRQDAINKSHPFGLPIWKPALYKKSRSVVRRANSALHSAPTTTPEMFLYPGNILWAIIFGWWLAIVMLILSLIMLLVPPDGYKYASVLRGLANYLFWPFGKYVQRAVDAEPESLSNYRVSSEPESQEDSDMDEDLGLISGRRHKRRNRLQTVKDNTVELFRLGPSGWMFYLLFYTVLAPLQLFVSCICWGCVITIPMAKLTYVLTRHLRRHPLSLHFKSSGSTLMPTSSTAHQRTVILLCTYQAIGLQYYKYTYDGINIIFINLLPVAFFVIFDEYVLHKYFPDAWFTKPALVFMFGLGSVIPLSYFIGMAVSSISAQSSMGMGAVINATFGSIIEIILYSVALMSGKSALVEGSLIGSFLAGVLLMPGCSMLSGAVKRKEQRFNAKSAGVTSTMLIMAIIAALSPTLFYQMYGSFELRCSGCPESPPQTDVFACSRCYYDQMNPAIDPVYQNSVKPLMWICALVLPSAYFIALVFSLHTHADMVWSSSHGHHGAEESNYRKLLPTHIMSQLIHLSNNQAQPVHLGQNQSQTDLGNGQGGAVDSSAPFNLPYNTSHVAVVTTSPIRSPIRGDDSNIEGSEMLPETLGQPVAPVTWVHAKEPEEEEDEEAAGHDSPNWSKSKSFTILFACTILYSLIAEILVDTVDIVMDSLAIDEKFLGLTLFALVPNITEFMNAISFALYGNIVLSLEIGSAYALQVCLIQIPAMVGFSLWYNWGMGDVAKYTFTLVFPRWDAICVIFSVFLLTYTYQEGKSNYFKGSILILSYFVLMAGFYLTPPSASHSVLDGTPMVMRF